MTKNKDRACMPQLDGTPPYPKPEIAVGNWKKYFLDINAHAIKEFAAFATKQCEEGKKTISQQEMLKTFCIAGAGDCKKHLEERLGGRSAKGRILAYAEAIAQLNAKIGLERIQREGGDEWLRPADQGREKGKYTHRFYINPQLNKLADIVRIIYETQQGLIGYEFLAPNLFRFKFISPVALASHGKGQVRNLFEGMPYLTKNRGEYVKSNGNDGKWASDEKIEADCYNFGRADRIIIAFHEDSFSQIESIIRAIDTDIKYWPENARNSALREEMPAFVIPYVYPLKGGGDAVFAFGLYGKKWRYGETIAQILSETYASLASKADFAEEMIKNAIMERLPDEWQEKVCKLYHIMYNEARAKYALDYMRNIKKMEE